MDLVEILKLLSSTSSRIAQGEVLQLEYKGEIDILEETYFNIINSKNCGVICNGHKNRSVYN